ncbi:MAG: DUF1631 family protein [Lysobacteraceae bacterium]
MAAPTDPQDPAPKTLATAGLPRRVRRTLDRTLALVSEELEKNLVTAISDFEEELFRLAERGGTTGGGGIDYMHVLRVVRLNRHDLVPRFMQLLEAGLAGLRKPGAVPSLSRPSSTPPQPLNFRNLSLVDESMMDEGAVLHEIASRQESRTNLVLHLLGQRFAVLAAAPAFDGERIPLGPQALCRAIRHAVEPLQLDHGARLLFYRTFDRRVMVQYPGLCEKLDALLLEEGVLPGLSYVPMRSRSGAGDDDAPNVRTVDDPAPKRTPGQGASAPTPQGGMRSDGAAGGPMGGFGGSHPAGPAGSGAQAPGPSGVPGGGDAPYDANRPHTVWLGQAMPQAEVDEMQAFRELHQRLGQRRLQNERLNPVPPGARTETPIPTRDLLQTLGRMDAEPTMPGGAATIEDIKQSLLAQARQQHGKPVALAPADNDTFDLLGLLYSHLQNEIRDDAPAAALVKRLQVTLLRVALQDRAFFVRPNHPARQLLSTVSDTAAKWLGDDDIDPSLLSPLQEAVTHAVRHFDGDVAVFEQSNQQLKTHIDAQVKRAETLEKRHVEAARGKEKLEAAKLRAEQVLAEVMGDASLPKFTRALLNQSWADVLTLTFLRHGEGSEEWKRQLDATRQVVAACTHRDTDAEHPALKTHVEAALKQVGYHDEEADVIARRLSSSLREDEDGESRTELTMKLKARVRLGEEAQKARKPDLPTRSEHEQECYEQLRLLPFGTWLEFVTNQQGDVIRRRMSWFSPVTGNALFVNQRGQRVGEHSLDSLARMMAKDQVRIVTAQRAGLVDRAWHAAINALRSLTGTRREGVEDEPGVPAADIAVRSVPAAPMATPEGAAARSVAAAAPPRADVEPHPGLIGDESAPPPKGDAR